MLCSSKNTTAYHSLHAIPTVKYSCGSYMLWECISLVWTVEPVRVKGKTSGDKYRTALEENILQAGKDWGRGPPSCRKTLNIYSELKQNELDQIIFLN